MNIKEDNSINELINLIHKYGIRYVIKNFKLVKELIPRIINNEFSDIYEEHDITEFEILFYQQKFNV